MEYTFAGKYKLEEEIAMGGCGTVFLGVHTIAGKEVAIKIEPAHPPHDDPTRPPLISSLTSPLQLESRIYKSLAGAPGVPWLMWSGRDGPYNVLVMEMMGPSLEDLFQACGRKFSMKTVLLIADQVISRIAYIHAHSLLHRDIKPANFVIGRPQCSPPDSDESTPPIPPTPTDSPADLINIIDFGLAARFRSPIPPYTHNAYGQVLSGGGGGPASDDAGQHGVGTPLFASLNTHCGISSGRRDDLESLSYMLFYFLNRGRLPWRGVRGEGVKGTWDAIREGKLAFERDMFEEEGEGANGLEGHDEHERNSISSSHAAASSKAAALTQSLKALPEEFLILYRYARGLAYDDLPDYEGLREMFQSLAARLGVEYDGAFDWVEKPEYSGAKTAGTQERVGDAAKKTAAVKEVIVRNVRRRVCEACEKRKNSLKR